MANSKAYEAGYKDGAVWDLDGYSSLDEVRSASTGWDEATINAMGKSFFVEACGISEDSPEFDRACADYNRGAVAGALSDEHNGLKPRE